MTETQHTYWVCEKCDKTVHDYDHSCADVEARLPWRYFAEYKGRAFEDGFIPYKVKPPTHDEVKVGYFVPKDQAEALFEAASRYIKLHESLLEGIKKIEYPNKVGGLGLENEAILALLKKGIGRE